MSPQGRDFPAEGSVYILGSSAEQHYNVSFRAVRGPATHAGHTLHTVRELHSAIQPPPPYNSLGYATAAERISGFLGPLFVRSKVDDISAIKGT